MTTINPMVLDISHHNDVSSFSAMYGFGIRGVIHKASQGFFNVDPMYAKRRQAARDAGLLWGAYHFADGTHPAGQAQHFLDAAKPDASTLLALDFEPNGSSTMTLAGARAFLQELEKASGRKPVLYSGNLIKETLKAPDAFFNSHRLWLAQYSDHPVMPAGWPNAWLWQFSGDGVNAHGLKIQGISGQVDINSFAGSAETLAAQWADCDLQTPAPAALVSERDRVRAMQQKLADHGLDPGAIDGVLGPATVRAFQKAAGIDPIDGLVGPTTRPLLEQALAAAA